MTHTKEPWIYQDRGGSVCADDERGTQVAHCQSVPGCAMLHDMAEVRANAKRIVACVNALAGIENPAEWVERAKKALGEK